MRSAQVRKEYRPARGSRLDHLIAGLEAAEQEHHNAKRTVGELRERLNKLNGSGAAGEAVAVRLVSKTQALAAEQLFDEAVADRDQKALALRQVQREVRDAVKALDNAARAVETAEQDLERKRGLLEQARRHNEAALDGRLPRPRGDIIGRQKPSRSVRSTHETEIQIAELERRLAATKKRLSELRDYWLGA